MPTREVKFLKDIDPATVPTNLIIRISSHMIDQGPVKHWPWTSTVTSGAAGRARPQNRGTNARTAGHAGTGPQPNVAYGKHNMIWRHPKILRRAPASSQGASLQALKQQADKPANPGPKAQASSQTQQDQESSSQSTSEQAHDPGRKQPE